MKIETKPKILIASVINKNARFYSAIPSRVNYKYARYHKYDFYIENRRLSSRHPAWDKVLLAAKSLDREYDYVWIVDADLIILNHQINLFSDIIKLNLDFDILASSDASNSGIQDKPNINTGSIIYKNTTWTKCFLDKWWNSGSGYLRKHFWEQSVINYLIQSEEEIASHIKILPEQSLNSIYPHEYNEPDQLCLHLMSITNQSRKILFKYYRNKVIYPKSQICKILNFVLGLE
jgi:hypothetical protein